MGRDEIIADLRTLIRYAKDKGGEYFRKAETDPKYDVDAARWEGTATGLRLALDMLEE